jgi:GWxTD domain-containing protein
MKTALYVVGAVFMLTLELAAQRAAPKSRQVQQVYGDACYADAMILPKPNTDSCDVSVLLRFNKGALVFSKVNSFQENRGSYYSVITMSIEARDAVGVVRQRLRYTDTVFVNSYENLAAESSYHHGLVTLSLAAGDYTVSIEPTTNRDNGFRRITLPKVVLPKAGGKQRGALSCLFAEALSQEYDTLRPIIFNGNMTFPAGRMAIVATVPQSTARTYDVWIRQQPYQDGDIRWWSGVDIHTTARSTGVALAVASASLVTATPLEKSGSTLVIPINAADVVPGRYMVTLVAEDTRDTLKYGFNVEWESMPLSLRSLTYALDVLGYICPEETLDSLRDGDEAAQREHLMEWWRRQDNSFGTAHNERMAEYYKRVDKASYEYATLSEPDGAFTDRGKVFILYGPASKIDRKNNKSGEVTETWIYTNSVRTIFLFTIEEAGRYRLTTVQPLRK